MATEDPFRVLLRKDNAYDPSVTIRFTVSDGMGQLSLKQPGKPEPGMSVHFEETGIEPELFRAARFVYNLNQQRQSFALSRITPELCARLPVEQWTELKPVIEFGFRYLVIPEDAFSATPPPVQVQVAASVVPASAPAAEAMRTPAPRAPAPATARAGDPVEPRTERPVPMEPTLAAAALDGLSREAAIAHLRTQLAAVDALHHRLEALERKLASARSREKDLLAVLTRWQERDSEPQ
jgi:hypothetical protein